MSAGQINDKPIAPELRDIMNGVARELDVLFNGKVPLGGKRETGFILLVFPFDTALGRTNYIANCARADVITLLKEQVRRFEQQEAPDAQGQA